MIQRGIPWRYRVKGACSLRACLKLVKRKIIRVGSCFFSHARGETESEFNPIDQVFFLVRNSNKAGKLTFPLEDLNPRLALIG